jgi:hypothetical protein
MQRSFLPPSSTLLGAVIVLAPLAAYCLIIARINRRARPLLVTGTRDCAGLILALAGVVFYLGPGLLTDFRFRPRDVWLYNHYSSLRGFPAEKAHEGWLLGWTVVCLAYVAAVVGGALLLLWRRQRTTSVYNVEPGAFDVALLRALGDLGLAWTRDENQIRVVGGGAPDGLTAVVEVAPWPAMRHVTLRWSADACRVQPLVEARLAQALGQVWTRTNPAGRWLMVASAGLFVLLFGLTVLYQAARFFEGLW